MSIIPVRVYRNLHKKCWSVQTKTKKGWRVTAHLINFCVFNPRYKVYKSGVIRAKKEGKRNVHAFIEGEYDIEFFTTQVAVSHAGKYGKRIIYNNGRFAPNISGINPLVVFTKNNAFLIERKK